MQGFQVTFFTEEGRHHGRNQVHVWLMESAKEGLHNPVLTRLA